MKTKTKYPIIKKIDYIIPGTYQDDGENIILILPDFSKAKKVLVDFNIALKNSKKRRIK